MKNTKKVWFVSCSLIVVVAVALAYGLVVKHHSPKTVKAAVTNAASESTVSSLPTTSSNNSDTQQAAGQLSVGSSQASSGILQGTTQTSGQPSTNSSGTGSQPNPFDPTKYAQYDKYQNGQSALFADVVKGDGSALADGHKAAVYYRGWLTNGTLFDESKPGADGKLQPFVFQLGAHQVIPGWEQALAGMKVGGVRLVIVPPTVGYGAQASGSIPANSVLIFQVQLAATE